MTASALRVLRPRARVPAAAVPLLLLVSLVALQGCDVVTADLKHSETAEWRKSYELCAVDRVEISNVNGKIEVTPSSGNTVEVVAQKTAKAATAEAAKEAVARRRRAALGRGGGEPSRHQGVGGIRWLGRLLQHLGR